MKLLGASWFMGSNHRSDIGMPSLNPFSPIIECDYTSMDKVVYPSSEANNYADWLNAMEIPSDKKISLTENASKESDFKVEEIS